MSLCSIKKKDYRNNWTKISMQLNLIYLLYKKHIKICSKINNQKWQNNLIHKSNNWENNYSKCNNQSIPLCKYCRIFSNNWGINKLSINNYELLTKNVLLNYNPYSFLLKRYRNCKHRNNNYRNSSKNTYNNATKTKTESANSNPKSLTLQQHLEEENNQTSKIPIENSPSDSITLRCWTLWSIK